jgi:MFS transporter, PAT family, beta-lactamase induction signal transducer AmpG
VNFERRLPPIWLMGLSNATLGFGNGITLFLMPQLMAEAHVPEAKIATITAVALSANFWFVLFGPILDVRFSRRWYATFFAALSGVAATLAVLSVHRLIVLQIATVVCMAAAPLSSSALGGWLSNITPHEQKNPLSKWINIALISGSGVIIAVGGELVHGLPLFMAAVVMGAIVVMPAAVFPFMPAPRPDRRLAAESFLQFNREVVSLLGRREVVIVLLLFLSPCSSFVLPNLLGGLGADFHASARVVSLAGGAGAFVPGLIGCFLFPVIARRLRLRSFYFANGILGCLFTLSLVVLPHTTTTFALAVFGEFLFQAVAFSIQIGIVFDAIGPENPLAATTFSFLTAATNVPVTYITLIDGHAYSIGGITALLFTDAAIGSLTCSIAFILLAKFDSRVARQKRLSIASTQEEG